MDSAQLLKYFQNPSLLNLQTLADFNNELEKYPYFSSLRILLIKNLKNINDYTFADKLKQNALYISDRKQLFRFLQSDSTQFVQKTDNKDVRREEKDSLKDNISDIIQQQMQQEANPVVAENLIIPDVTFELDETQGVVLKELENSDYKSFAAGSVLEFETLDLIDEGAETNSMSENDVVIEEKQQEPISEPEDKLLNTRDISDYQLTDEDSKPTADLQNQNLPFTAWLDQLSPETAKVSKQDNELPIPEPSGFDLIDKFLAENPRISPKMVNEEQEDISQASIEERDDFITDTLAKIYVKQGNYEKAIATYEKLSLKFPEKSTYFASQIEEINRLINK